MVWGKVDHSDHERTSALLWCGELVEKGLGLLGHFGLAELEEAVARADEDRAALIGVAGMAKKLADGETDDADAFEAADLKEDPVRLC